MTLWYVLTCLPVPPIAISDIEFDGFPRLLTESRYEEWLPTISDRGASRYFYRHGNGRLYNVGATTGTGVV